MSWWQYVPNTVTLQADIEKAKKRKWPWERENEPVGPFGLRRRLIGSQGEQEVQRYEQAQVEKQAQLVERFKRFDESLTPPASQGKFQIEGGIPFWSEPPEGYAVVEGRLERTAPRRPGEMPEWLESISDPLSLITFGFGGGLGAGARAKIPRTPQRVPTKAAPKAAEAIAPEVTIAKPPRRDAGGNLIKRQPKEEWQITKSDYIFYRKEPQNFRVPLSQQEQILAQQHERVVRQALSEGKSVPPEVLKDYPDLAKVAPVTPEVTRGLVKRELAGSEERLLALSKKVGEHQDISLEQVNRYKWYPDSGSIFDRVTGRRIYTDRIAYFTDKTRRKIVARSDGFIYFTKNNKKYKMAIPDFEAIKTERPHPLEQVTPTAPAIPEALPKAGVPLTDEVTKLLIEQRDFLARQRHVRGGIGTPFEGSVQPRLEQAGIPVKPIADKVKAYSDHLIRNPTDRAGADKLFQEILDAFDPKRYIPKSVTPTAPAVAIPKVAIPEALPKAAVVEKAITPKVSRVKPPEGRVPEVPTVTPEGRLWLPEPPRETSKYIAFAKEEMAGSFRAGFRKAKQGAVETIEIAHQQVLKARDLGDNVVNYVQSYVRIAGKVTDEFGLNAEGIASKVKSDRSLAINDILSNPTRYNLTAAQQEIAKRFGFVYREALKLARSYGVKINELGGADEFWQYIARRVRSRVNPQTGLPVTPSPSIGGLRMGAKISAQKERIFEEMAEGLDLGFLYENPAETLGHYIKGIYRLIGNKQAENTVIGLTRQITKEAPLKFGERFIGQPALNNRVAATELVNAINKIFTPEQPIKALKVAADVSGAIVAQKAALDVSAPFIQGLTILSRDISSWMRGRPSNAWAKAYAGMWKAVANPETINAYRTSNQALYKEALEAGVMTGASEFTAGVPLAGKVLGKIPGAGKTLQEAYRQTWGRMGAAFSDFLEVSRIETFKVMKDAWIRQGGNIYDLGAFTNRLSGVASASARGVGVNRRLVERSLAFAPNYLRASFLLLGDMFKTGIKADEARRTIATMLGVGFMAYYAEEKVRGREPKIKPWPKRLGGDGAEAFTTEIFGTRVGFGAWMYGMIKTAAELGAVAVDDPASLAKWNDNHPMVRYAKSKAGAGISLMSELVLGRNFFNQPFEGPKDYFMRLVEGLMPIAGQSLIEKQSLEAKKSPAEVATRVGAELAGLRAFPYTLKSRWTDEGHFKAYEAIPKDEVERKGKGMPYSREQFRTNNPNVDARLFVTEQVTGLQSDTAIAPTLALIKQYGINPKSIKGIEARLELREKRRKAGVQETEVTPTDKLMYQLGIASLPQVPLKISRPSGFTPSQREKIRARLKSRRTVR